MTNVVDDMYVASGVARPEMSGIISNMADQARKLEPTSSVIPIVRLESDQGCVYSLLHQIKSKFFFLYYSTFFQHLLFRTNSFCDFILRSFPPF